MREAESVPLGGAPASLVVESMGITVRIHALYSGMSLCTRMPTIAIGLAGSSSTASETAHSPLGKRWVNI